MTKIYLLSRKIHRFFTLITLTLTLIMAGTGTLIKFPQLAEALKVNSGMVRYVHGNISVVFTISLFLMAATGTFMYFWPWIIKKVNK